MTLLGFSKQLFDEKIIILIGIEFVILTYPYAHITPYHCRICYSEIGICAAMSRDKIFKFLFFRYHIHVLLVKNDIGCFTRWLHIIVSKLLI